MSDLVNKSFWISIHQQEKECMKSILDLRKKWMVDLNIIPEVALALVKQKNFAFIQHLINSKIMYLKPKIESVAF